ncbi:MAG: hypothetical protein JWP02_125 [Acidimicrobiales bacterium]|nr:hypothetical protein [Acidimicrobiales bacterium]
MTTRSVRAPRLLDASSVDTASGEIWWAVLERLPGAPSERPTVEQQHALGTQLRRWHSCGPGQGLRLDDPGALGVLLGWARKTVPRAYPGIAERFSHACAGFATMAGRVMGSRPPRREGRGGSRRRRRLAGRGRP